MNILIYGNCQSKQIALSLQFLLMGRVQIEIIETWWADAQSRLDGAKKNEKNIDLILTNKDKEQLAKYFDKNKIVEIPSISFGGFHPDVAQFSLSSSPAKPFFFENNPTVSAIALTCLINKIPKDKAISLYNEDVFYKLKYFDYFDISCDAIVKSYERVDISAIYIERFLVGREVFMHGPLHPKLNVVIGLCLGVLEKINEKPLFTIEELDGIVPDPLAKEYAWGCYPPLASRLSVNGSWLSRNRDIVYPTVDDYLTEFYSFMSRYPAEDFQIISWDKRRYDDLHNIDNVIKEYV